MKKIILLALLFASVSSSAELLSRKCDKADYDRLKAALRNGQVIEGTTLVTVLTGILMEKQGLSCEVLIDSEFNNGIPDDSSREFEFRTPIYHLRVIVNDIPEMEETLVSIKSIPIPIQFGLE